MFETSKQARIIEGRRLCVHPICIIFDKRTNILQKIPCLLQFGIYKDFDDNCLASECYLNQKLLCTDHSTVLESKLDSQIAMYGLLHPWKQIARDHFLF
jgi:hypothetical protein